MDFKNVSIAFLSLIERYNSNKRNIYAKNFISYTEVLIKANNSEANVAVKNVIRSYIDREGFSSFDALLRNYIEIGLSGMKNVHKESCFDRIHNYYMNLL